jgi:hypothetical protein
MALIFIGASCMASIGDDAVLAFELKDDTEQVVAVLPKRFARLGLKLHPNDASLGGL